MTPSLFSVCESCRLALDRELVFLDCGATDLAFLRGLRRVITKVDSKVRSLDSPV